VTASPRTLTVCVVITTEERAEPSWVPQLEDCSPALRRALERVGLQAGELWLHLLGIGLERGAPTAAELVDAVAELAPAELRRHLVGVHVPAWRALVGADTLEAAARGDRNADAVLLADECYYGGRARDSLSLLLPLSVAQTKKRVADVLRRFHNEVFAAREDELVAQLERDVDAKRARSLSPDALITAATRGYVYEPEPELGRVVLVPHLAARPWILLCQHRTTRLICYAAEPESAPHAQEVRARALKLGRALGDEKRVLVLARLAAGEAGLAELAESAGLAKSTVHHHLVLLRDAGLVGMRGNDQGYRYFLRAEGATESSGVLGDLLAPR